ncbi:MAG: hypothetical protein WD556_07825 [Actinomycetota bacterium]
MDRVRWAEFEGSVPRSLTADEQASAWMALTPPDYQPTSIFQATSRYQLPLTLVQPVKVSAAWSGLVQIHEVGHTYDWVMGFESPRSRGHEWAEGEIRAHQMERAMINLVSDGSYSDALRAFADVGGIPSVDHLLEGVNQGNGTLVQLNQLDQFLSPEEPQSDQEIPVRYGTHVFALGLELVDLTHRADDREKAYVAFCLEYMKVRGIPTGV